MTEVPV